MLKPNPHEEIKYCVNAISINYATLQDRVNKILKQKDLTEEQSGKYNDLRIALEEMAESMDFVSDRVDE